MLTLDTVCPHCKKELRIGLEVTVPCNVWCPLCRENLQFNGSELVSLGSKVYGWLYTGRWFHVG